MSESLDEHKTSIGDLDAEETTIASDASQCDGDWKATNQIKWIVTCLSTVSIVVALDATILVAALPVSTSLLSIAHGTKIDDILRHLRLHSMAQQTKLSGSAQRTFSPVQFFSLCLSLSPISLAAGKFCLHQLCCSQVGRSCAVLPTISV